MNGIICAGNWILDQVKIIDTYPKTGELCNIHSQTIGPGGSPFNLLVDYAHLGVDFPTWGMGCIGDDTIGKSILDICTKEKVSTEFIQILKNTASSYTDVMTIKETGERTFFHCRGANSKFSPDHIPLETLKTLKPKIFHLGYLLLLDEMEKSNENQTIIAAQLLKNIQSMGIQTSIDVVTEASDRYKEIIIPCLPFVDHLIINEIEAGNITGYRIRRTDGSFDIENAKNSAKFLLKKGVHKTVVIHLPEGALWAQPNMEAIFTPSFNIPIEKIIGTVGAGDAFCAGTLWGLHEGWDYKKTLAMANGIAAACLQASNTTDGVGSKTEIEKLIKIYSKCK